MEDSHYDNPPLISNIIFNFSVEYIYTWFLPVDEPRDRKWMTFDYTANSLYYVIADGKFRPTIAARDKWKVLISGSSLQYNCNREEFNVLHNRVR